MILERDLLIAVIQLLEDIFSIGRTDLRFRLSILVLGNNDLSRGMTLFQKEYIAEIHHSVLITQTHRYSVHVKTETSTREVPIMNLDLIIKYPEPYCGFTRSIQENSGIVPRLGYELLRLSDSLFMSYLNP